MLSSQLELEEILLRASSKVWLIESNRDNVLRYFKIIGLPSSVRNQVQHQKRKNSDYPLHTGILGWEAKLSTTNILLAVQLLSAQGMTLELRPIFVSQPPVFKIKHTI